MQGPHSAICSSEEHDNARARWICTELEALYNECNLLHAFGRNTQFRNGISMADIIDHNRSCCYHDLDNMFSEAMEYIRTTINGPLPRSAHTIERHIRVSIDMYKYATDVRRRNRIMCEEFDRHRAREKEQNIWVAIGSVLLAAVLYFK